jgi:DegV family protein with EDD domain
MTTRIVTDSTCDLPEDVIAQYGITVVPLYINFGLEGYLDGVEITRREFYDRLPDCDPLPTTAAPSSEAFRETYEDLVGNGATEILSIHVASSLSATANSARVGADSIQGATITVFDSRQISCGLGFQVLAAAQAIQGGSPVDQVLAALKSLVPRVYVFAALGTMEFLRRSGRVNPIVAGLGNTLQIKPLLKLIDGELASERARTSKRAIERVIALLEEVAPVEQLAIVHANAADRAQALKEQVQNLAPGGDLWTVDIAPAIGTHIGPGAVGVACVSQTS